MLFRSISRRYSAFWGRRVISSQSEHAVSFRTVERSDIEFVAKLYENERIVRPNDPYTKQYLEYLVNFQPNTHPGYIIEKSTLSNSDNSTRVYGYVGTDLWHLGQVAGVVSPETKSGWVNFLDIVLDCSGPYPCDESVSLEVVKQIQDIGFQRSRKESSSDDDILVLRTVARSSDKFLQHALQKRKFQKLPYDPFFDPYGESSYTALFDKYDDPVEYFDFLNPKYAHLQAVLSDNRSL